MAGHLQQLIVTEIQPVLKKHQDSVHESIVSVVRSQAATPVPQQPDIERIENQIMELLRRNKINDAFQVVRVSFSTMHGVIARCDFLKPLFPK